MQNTEIAIIGGGPSGMMAAITAAAMGAQVTLLEKMDKVGKKLLITGRGRCNLSNTQMDASHFHSGKKNFVRDVLSRFGLNETLAFFDKIGIPTKSEKEGKIIPWSEQAAAVLDILRLEMQDLGVNEKTGFQVKEIQALNPGFLLKDSKGDTLQARTIILATGGKSYPGLGPNGEGYKLARQLGHSIIEPRPALVHVKCKTPYSKQINGNKFIGTARLEIDGRTVKSYSGEILFTDYGLSGIPLLQLSRRITEALTRQQQVRILLDLFPEIELEKLIILITNRIKSRPQRSITDSFTGLLHKKLVPVLLYENGISDKNKTCSTLNERTIRSLTTFLKAWPFTPTGTRDWDVAQVTAGGINVKEIDPATLESRIVSGLYFAGEVMDVDGECGGYNLQWAWSSGFTAGSHAAQKLEEQQ